MFLNIVKYWSKLKVSKSRKQFMVPLILPKNERNILRILKYPYLVPSALNEISDRARGWFLLFLRLFSNLILTLIVKRFFQKERVPILKQFCEAKIFPLFTKYIWVKSFLQSFLWDMTYETCCKNWLDRYIVRYSCLKISTYAYSKIVPTHCDD